MRSAKQLATVLALALGTCLPLAASQHFAPPRAQVRQSNPPRQQRQAPQRQAPQREVRQQRQAPPRPARQNEIRQQRQAQRQEMQSARPMSANPQPYRSQGEVPRPPQRTYAGPNGSVPRPPQRQVPRPPMSNTLRAGQENAPSHNVPRPPQATTQQPMVGDARPAVPRPPVIGSPRDVHQGPTPHAGDWLRRYSSMPPQQRQRALESDPAFRHLSPTEQQRYRNQLNSFSSKPPQEQQRVINRMDAWGHLSPAQKDQARATYGQLKSMPADRQQEVNRAFRRLQAMPPSARQQVMNSPEFQSHYSEQERGIIRSMTDINSSLPH